MHADLITYCSQFVDLNPAEKELIKENFHFRCLKRKSFLLEEGKTCDFIAFIKSGIIRHFHIRDGNEITCDITVPNSFITDFKSFNESVPSVYNFQVLKEACLLIINKQDLLNLYEEHKTFETLGRIMAERVAQRTIDIAMSLASEKPEERVRKLLLQQAELFQLVPQKYLANLLGISPESFSRIRARQAAGKKS